MTPTQINDEGCGHELLYSSKISITVVTQWKLSVVMEMSFTFSIIQFLHHIVSRLKYLNLSFANVCTNITYNGANCIIKIVEYEIFFCQNTYKLYSERPSEAGFRSVNPAERWRDNPARDLARARFSQHLECGIHRSQSSPEGSFALILNPVARWAETTP